MGRVHRLPRSALIVVLGVAVVASVGIGISAAGPRPTPTLPRVSAQALLTSSLSALGKPASVSGDVKTTLDLGLPEIPASLSGAAGAAGLTNALASLAGAQRWRVWSSPDGLRIQHLMDLQEQDLVANPTAVWFWDSATSTATKLRVTRVAATLPAPPRDAGSAMANADPTQLARMLLQTASTCGAVSVSGTAVVAGRDAYLLTFRPTSAVTLVGRVTIAIDSRTRLPLAVSVFARGAAHPAADARFTSVSFSAIDPTMFAFSPPPDSTVRDVTDRVARALAHRPREEPRALRRAPRPVVAGTCLDASVAVRLAAPLPRTADGLLPYAGPLASVIAVERGGATWVVAGPVGVATLERRANALP